MKKGKKNEDESEIFGKMIESVVDWTDKITIEEVNKERSKLGKKRNAIIHTIPKLLNNSKLKAEEKAEKLEKLSGEAILYYVREIKLVQRLLDSMFKENLLKLANKQKKITRDTFFEELKLILEIHSDLSKQLTDKGEEILVMLDKNQPNYKSLVSINKKLTEFYDKLEKWSKE